MDCNIYFFGSSVPIGAMYAVILGAVVALVGAYVLINVLKSARKRGEYACGQANILRNRTQL
ncbi:MAG: hypothetical protein ACLUSP_01635 [Christensenellales bacterium]